MSMTRKELLSWPEKIRNAEGDSEEEIDGNIDLFLRNVPDSDATKYFFSRKFEGMTLEE